MNDWLYAGLKSHREPNAVAERVLADRYEVLHFFSYPYHQRATIVLLLVLTSTEHDGRRGAPADAGACVRLRRLPQGAPRAEAPRRRVRRLLRARLAQQQTPAPVRAIRDSRHNDKNLVCCIINNA